MAMGAPPCPQGDPEDSGPLQLIHLQPVPQSMLRKRYAWGDPKGGAGAIAPGWNPTPQGLRSPAASVTCGCSALPRPQKVLTCC